MKKIVSVLLCVVMIFSISACGTKEESKADLKKEDNKTEKVDVKEEKQESVYFKDDVLKIDMATIKITGFEVAPPNTDWGETKPTLIITYDFTNNSEELMQPGITWMSCFNATQETEATVDQLDAALSPQDPKYADANTMSFTDIKPGATVSSVMSYNINDTTKEITLAATQGMTGKELGTKVFTLQ